MSTQELYIGILLATNSALLGLLLFFVKGIYTEFKAATAKQAEHSTALAVHGTRLDGHDDRLDKLEP